MIYEYEFSGRKPSNAQVLKHVNEAIRQNCRVINLSWGENWLEFQRMPAGIWLGSGWIRNISGADLAVQVNRALKSNFVKDHFQFINVA